MSKRRKGSSKAGRPRKDGARYPGGKLKPREPNAEIIARRKAGDASAGEHPLDFALSNNWITERQHRDGMGYRATFSLAHAGASGPRLACGSLREVEPAEALRMNWSQLNDEEITAIFDRVFSGLPMPGDRERAEAAALTRWKLLNAALTQAEREELFMVCVLGCWPFWMPKEASGHALGVKDQAKRVSLFEGLKAVSTATKRRERDIGRITSVPYVPTRDGKAEAPILYVTEEGETLVPRSERGRAFEATILRKRV